jgi:hypothetical protein
MSDQPNSARAAASLLASQRTYYAERADNDGDVSKPARKTAGLMKLELCRALIDEPRPARLLWLSIFYGRLAKFMLFSYVRRPQRMLR